MTFLRSSLVVCFAVFAFGAFAQPTDYYDTDSGDHIDRLERDLQLLQRQLSRGATTTTSTSDDIVTTGSPTARVTQLEESIRRFEGRIEELQHQNEELKAQIERITKDTEFRLKAIEDRQAAAAVAPVAVATPQVTQPAESEDAPPPSLPNGKTASARDLYNSALQLLRQHKVDEAGAAFGGFVKQYPKDPLIPNAYYWLGETYYVRSDFPKAADSFRQGFELGPKGPKAGDNLLKLGMSLDAMKRAKEACVVFKQIGIKYPNTPAAIKAGQELTRANCL